MFSKHYQGALAVSAPHRPMTREERNGTCMLPINWKWIVPCMVLATSIRCTHPPRSANQQPPSLENVKFDVVTIEQLTVPHAGPSKAEIEQLKLKEVQQLIDSSLMPRASPETCGKLVSIKNVMGRADRDGEVFLREADNFAGVVTASADLMLIAGTIYPDNLEVQLHIPSTLLMTVSNLESLRGIGVSRDVGPDIARYTSEAVKFARKTVDRFPDAGRAYGQLGFVLSLTGGGKEEIQQLFKRCIDMDSKTESTTRMGPNDASPQVRVGGVDV